MRILADENIACAREAFGGIGPIRILPGRGITHETLGEAEILLVRSVTRVDAKLLASSRVRFVGSATIGTDHIDIQYLIEQGIPFATAPGSNAESVAQYVAAALCRLRAVSERDLRWKSIGIIGVGNCGSRVERIAAALEMDAVLCDPPLARATGDARYQDPKYLQDCDFITAHVPLTSSGEDATAGMFNSAFFDFMKPGLSIINTSRGGIMNEMALLRATQTRRVAFAAIDVWSREPSIDPDLLRSVTLGTPHIAGYSMDGKLRATEMLHRAVCDFLGEQPSWSAADALPRTIATFEINPGLKSREQTLADLILEAYPVQRDDLAMRRILDLPPEERAGYFDSLRTDYPVRREFAATSVAIKPNDGDLAEAVRALGFRVDPPCAEAPA